MINSPLMPGQLLPKPQVKSYQPVKPTKRGARSSIPSLLQDAIQQQSSTQQNMDQLGQWSKMLNMGSTPSAGSVSGPVSMGEGLGPLAQSSGMGGYDGVFNGINANAGYEPSQFATWLQGNGGLSSGGASAGTEGAGLLGEGSMAANPAGPIIAALFAANTMNNKGITDDWNDHINPFRSGGKLVDYYGEGGHGFGSKVFDNDGAVYSGTKAFTDLMEGDFSNSLSNAEDAVKRLFDFKLF